MRSVHYSKVIMHIDKKQPRLSTKQHNMQNDKRGAMFWGESAQENPSLGPGLQVDEARTP